MRETLLSFLDDCLARGEETAVVRRRGLRLSRSSGAEIAGRAFQFARELEVRGIGHGDRVLFWTENSPEWIAAFFGCLLRGVIVVPLDLKSTPDFVARVQEQVSAKLLFTDVLPLDHHSTAPYTATQISTDDLVEIVFTSGTTTEPKGVCLTHRNLLANLKPIETEFRKYARWERLVHPLRFLCLLPLSHVFGQLMGIFVPQITGAEVHFLESYKPSDIIETAKKQRINVVISVPRVLETLREKLVHDHGNLARDLETAGDRHFLRNWWAFRHIRRRFGWRLWAFVSGGATLEPQVETFWRRLGYAVVQGYGMTETASLTSLSHPFRTVQGSIGKPVAGQEVKLNGNGEILVRGDSVSPGYWRGGVKPLADEQGWIHTGDIGEVGPNGHIFFRGRSKETIVTAAGMKIYPSDLESALDSQPEIKASAVIPFDDTEAMAVLIPSEPNADLNAAVARANASLAEFQRIRHWTTWPEPDFPRTIGTRKIIKEQLRNHSSPHSIVIPTISDLDSLGRVELLSKLEDQYQIELDEAAITETTTVEDLEQMVRKGQAEAVPYPYPSWAMRFPTTWIRPLIYHLFLLPLSRIMCSVRTEGVERLRNVNGPALLISNHVTHVDAPLIVSALPFRWRLRLAIAMSGEHLREWRSNKKLTYALGAALFNVFPLPRQSGFRKSFAYAGEAIDRGFSVLIFPEGHETTDGRIQSFKAGIGMLAADLNVPIVPIKLDGLFELKQRRQFFVRPGTVTVTFGEPVQFPPEQTPEEITRELEARVKEL
ncbi:MAG TPA: AMP-binding protein [Pyrinomonadaceae bacterium]|nr:AMP-binding protein [Pyrinomonadaceae bacterium]